jgi:hypothetical protein
MHGVGIRAALILLCTFCAASAQASVEISTAATKNMSCSSGVCSPTEKKAVLNVNDLTNMLAAGDVKITTGNGADAIGILSPFAWASTHHLTLDAFYNVNIKAQVMVQGTSGLTIITNDGGTGGDLVFYQGAKIDFWDLGSSLIINGNSYTLLGGIASLASDIAANPSGFYALANDYDASVDGRYNRSPITTELTGTFEGLGHTISNLSIESDSAAALFKKASGTLRDIGLSNVDIVSSGGAASLLAEDDAATIIGCHATGYVLAGTAGGLVAMSSNTAGGTIIRSRVAVDVYANYNGAAGGLVGVSFAPYALNISLSYASGHVGGGNNSITGGLVALMSGGSISQSFATGGVKTGYDGEAGGLVGHFYGGSIQDSYATGEVGSRFVAKVGGFASWIDVSSIVHSSFSVGLVKRGSLKHADRGGFLGAAGSGDDLEWDYWDVDTSGMTQGCGSGACNGVTGQSDTQMKSALPSGFRPKIWGQNPNINNGYPYLLANPPQ